MSRIPGAGQGAGGHRPGSRVTAAHIGILAHSVPGAGQCLQDIARHSEAELGAYRHPTVTLDCIEMARSMPAWEAGDHGRVRAILAASVERLARAGCDLFVCPDNTAHLALESPGAALPLPGLHIADVVAQRAAAAGYRTVGVLGTRWTMEAALYPRVLAGYGIAARVPDVADRTEVQRFTFDQLVHGIFTAAARERFVEVISRLRDAGCDAVALVCTEFPLLVPEQDSPLPILNSTDLIARAAVDVALGARPQPTWRGGPYPNGHAEANSRSR
jgi:aspartate racemase